MLLWRDGDVYCACRSSCHGGNIFMKSVKMSLGRVDALIRL